jgi:hypothetical protein
VDQDNGAIMTNYAITGSLGDGKGIMAMARMREYLMSGRKVITNIDVKMENFMSGRKAWGVLRCSDFPTSAELDQFGMGCDKYDQKMFGGIFLDETLLWLNSRAYGDKDRMNIIKWLRHARKRRWDVYLLMQDIGAIDKQVRASLIHNEAACRAGDKMSVPVVGPVIKMLTGWNIPMPSFHLAVVKSLRMKGMVVDRWFTRGKEFYNSYDTMQEYHGHVEGLSCTLDRATCDYLSRPETAATRFYDAAWAIKEKYPRLARLIPPSFFHPPQELARHVDFIVAERDGPPRREQQRTIQTFDEWSAANPKESNIHQDEMAIAAE